MRLSSSSPLLEAINFRANVFLGMKDQLIRNLQHAHVLHRKLDEAEAHRVAVAEGGRKRLGVVCQAESQKQALILRDSPPART